MSESKKWITVWTDWSKPDTPKQFIECSDIEAVVLEVIKAERIAEANRETLRRVAEKQAEVDQPRDPMSDFYIPHVDDAGKVYYTEKEGAPTETCLSCGSTLPLGAKDVFVQRRDKAEADLREAAERVVRDNPLPACPNHASTSIYLLKELIEAIK